MINRKTFQNLFQHIQRPSAAFWDKLSFRAFAIIFHIFKDLENFTNSMIFKDLD